MPKKMSSHKRKQTPTIALIKSNYKHLFAIFEINAAKVHPRGTFYSVIKLITDIISSSLIPQALR